MRNAISNPLGKKGRLLLACGAIGCTLFILGFFIEGATRAGYDSFRHPISSLSIGEFGWMQVANFIITGLLLLAFAIGLRHRFESFAGRVWAPVLFGLVAIGLIGSGIFSTDAVYGYPPEKPLLLSQVTLHGNLHIVFSLLVFIGLPSACFVFHKLFVGRGRRGWAAYSNFTGIAIVATFALSGIGFKQFSWFVEYAGVFQRLSIISGFTWIILLAFLVIKEQAEQK